MKTEILRHCSRGTAFAFRLIKIGTVSVAVVQVDKCCKCLPMAVFNQWLPDKSDRALRHSPPVAEVSVLGSGPGKGIVEAPNRQK